MRISRWFFLLPLGVACTDPIRSDAFGDPTSTVIAPGGVIRGSVLYQGPRPCSSGGHIVGGAVVLVFDRRNPPPPAGLANTAVNFIQVTGDTLFANEPRWTGSDRYCPKDHGFTETITASAPFAVSPLPAASYMIESFYDYTGDFLPTFKFRNLPERGDVGGGAIDTGDALKAINQNPNYSPIFLPIDVGTPRPLPQGSPPGTIPVFDLPASGFVADNVQISIGQVLTNTRPYAYAQGLVIPAFPSPASDCWSAKPPAACARVPALGESSDQAHDPKTSGNIPGSVDASSANYAPILTMPQDILTFGPPQNQMANLGTGQIAADMFEKGGPCLSPACSALAGSRPVSGFPHLRLMWGTGSATQTVAVGTPFNMQISPFASSSAASGGFNVWVDEYLGTSATAQPLYKPRQIPEGGSLPNLWPSVILSKLEDDPTHSKDPASLQAQGSATEPVVIIQGITLTGNNSASGGTDTDSVYSTILSWVTQSYTDNATGNPIIVQQDHITTMLRPAALCFDSLFDPNASDKRGVIVTPYLFNDSTDFSDATMGPTPVPNTALVPRDILTNNDPTRQQITSLVKAPPGWTAASGQPPAIQGCLPTGRYAVNVVYPDGQAWTIPNEAGACTGTATGEGDTNWSATPISCTIQPRPVIRSQGPRAVVEVVASTTGYCKAHPVPSVCLPHK